jgi:hypothetical protein
MDVASILCVFGFFIEKNSSAVIIYNSIRYRGYSMCKSTIMEKYGKWSTILTICAVMVWYALISSCRRECQKVHFYRM